MNKRLFAALVAALLLVSATACTKEPDDNETLAPPESGSSESTSDNYIDGTETDTNGNIVTETSAETSAETEKPIEVNPTFKEVNKTVVVFAENGTVRAEANLASAAKGYQVAGDMLTATGESNDWYRLSYGEENEVAYIAKTIAGDAADLEGFTEINDTVTITDNINVRSFPIVTKYSYRGNLAKGDTVTRVAVGKEWSRILFTETVKAEDGTETEVTKVYYIHNDYIKTDETTTESATETAAATETTTESATEAATEA